MLSEAKHPPAPTRAARLLDDLNPQQRAAVLCTHAPLIIVAGPGTGKTRTLTVRIAYLILEKQVPPESALAITFTNKAAAEMAERLAGLLGDETASRVTIKTFHAFGALLLRHYAGRLGLSPDFAILSDDDRQALLKQARPELKQQEIDQALALISTAKNHLLLPDSPGLPAGREQLPAIYRSYQAALQAGQALDYDDLILRTVLLLEACPDVLTAVQARYRWISVDEYQDVNLAQYRLLRLLTGDAEAASGAGPGNLCVIGDPDQAIYGFRGADRQYFLSFQQDYPAALSLSLSQNYRSTQLILDAAMQVIGRGGTAPTLQAVQILTHFAEQIRLDVHQAPSDKAEAEYVVHQIEQMVGGTSYFSLDSGRVEGAEPFSARSFADFVVLYRLTAQSRLLVEALERSGIPFQTVGQTPLYAAGLARDVLAHLWLLHAPRSSVHLETVLAAGKPAVTATTVQELQEFMGRRSAGEDSLGAALQAASQALALPGTQRRRLSALAGFWQELERSREAGLPVARLVEQVHDFLAQQRGHEPEAAEERLLQQLALRAAPFAADLAVFLASTALQSETDAYDPRADRVTLLTLHAAKGLEFPVVFIVGCEEGLLPYQRPGEPADVAEERRLFYVGMTRAQQRLLLLSAQTRFLFGQRMANPPSRFVQDIEAALKEVREVQRRSDKSRSDGVQLSLFS